MQQPRAEHPVTEATAQALGLFAPAQLRQR